LIRRNLITGDPILFAPERAKRPHAFGRDDDGGEDCPFCPGNEHLTPPTLFAAGEPWRIRVFANKYSAAEGHEVIVESPRHDATLADADAAELARVWAERYRLHARSAAYVSLFKNEGARGGASIDHLHSQLLPLPFVPPRVERETSSFARAGKCPLCPAISSGIVVLENEHFVSIAPAASAHAYEQWIIPRRHQNEMASFGADELAAFGAIAQQAARAARAIAPAGNIIFMNFPRQPKAHCYVEIFPRMTSIAGFELGTGTFIDIIDPATAARRLMT
jgi:UDPglucose--hexose-1-phosphate uridylyltransferase